MSRSVASRTYGATLAEATLSDRFNGIIRRAFPPDGSSVPVSLGLAAEKGVRGRLPWSCTSVSVLSRCLDTYIGVTRHDTTAKVRSGPNDLFAHQSFPIGPWPLASYATVILRGTWRSKTGTSSTADMRRTPAPDFLFLFPSSSPLPGPRQRQRHGALSRTALRRCFARNDVRRFPLLCLVAFGQLPRYRYF